MHNHLNRTKIVAKSNQDCASLDCPGRGQIRQVQTYLQDLKDKTKPTCTNSFFRHFLKAPGQTELINDKKFSTA